MGAISYNRFRSNPGKVFDEVVDAEEAVTVTREDGRDVVIIPAKEFESWKETLHLLGRKKTPHACARQSRKSRPRLPAAGVEVWWSKRAKEDMRTVGYCPRTP